MEDRAKVKIRKYRIIIIVALAVVIVTALFLAHMPERIEGTMTVSTSTGETAEVDIDILYFSNFILPSYVKGTLTVDGVEYTDEYTKLKEFPYVSDNRLYSDESNQIDGTIEGISFWGPAQNAEEAKEIMEFFGYRIP